MCDGRRMLNGRCVRRRNARKTLSRRALTSGTRRKETEIQYADVYQKFSDGPACQGYSGGAGRINVMIHVMQ